MEGANWRKPSPSPRRACRIFVVNRRRRAWTRCSSSWGNTLAAEGQIDAGYGALTEALRQAWAVGQRLIVAAALEGLAGLMAPAGQAALGAQLLGAASAMRAAMGTPVWLVDRAAVEQTLATTRSALGANTFAQMWRQPSPCRLNISSTPFRTH